LYTLPNSFKKRGNERFFISLFFSKIFNRKVSVSKTIKLIILSLFLTFPCLPAEDQPEVVDQLVAVEEEVTQEVAPDGYDVKLRALSEQKQRNLFMDIRIWADEFAQFEREKQDCVFEFLYYSFLTQIIRCEKRDVSSDIFCNHARFRDLLDNIYEAPAFVRALESSFNTIDNSKAVFSVFVVCHLAFGGFAKQAEFIERVSKETSEIFCKKGLLW
jgi:hypothetical protein